MGAGVKDTLKVDLRERVRHEEGSLTVARTRRARWPRRVCQFATRGAARIVRAISVERALSGAKSVLKRLPKIWWRALNERDEDERLPVVKPKIVSERVVMNRERG